MILVTGATGNVGGQVVRELTALGEPVRAFVRDADNARALLGPELELAVGDFAEPASVREALAGADRLFLSSGDGPEKVAWETAAIDAAAAAAGVELIVKCSTMLAEPGSPVPTLDWHGRIEEHLAHSGVPHTIVRSCFYMTNLLMSAEPVRGGTLPAPAGTGRIAMIDPRDSGSAAASILAQGGYEGRTVEVTGPEAISYAEVAEMLAQATGRPVAYADVPPEALAGLGLPDWLHTQLVGIFELVRAGRLEPTTETFARITGREPRSFAEFAREHAAPFSAPLAPA